jgi:hypothetical protein
LDSLGIAKSKKIVKDNLCFLGSYPYFSVGLRIDECSLLGDLVVGTGMSSISDQHFRPTLPVLHYRPVLFYRM